MKKSITLLLFVLTTIINAKTLIVGLDSDLYSYQTMQSAAIEATPGDTIIMTGGIYPEAEYIENLIGEDDAPIYILAQDGDSVIYRGANQAIHFVQLENVIISGLIFEGQTVNGVNIDDGGTYETPSRNIVITNCHWLGMNAIDNNDELKLSCVDNFNINNCTFSNGSVGGSLVDMVGCHNGYFQDNVFENGGSNCIQAKGGTSDIRIERNMFINGGLRAINIGGSTGLQYFRPLGVDYEAQNINVYANIFIGSQAPIAYVGAVNCNVVNNTIVNPDKWAIRILQESVEGFQPCGDNAFVNNICYLNNSNPNWTLNISGNTAPETFFFANNLWFNFEDESWTGPNLPVVEENGIIGENPLFSNIDENDFVLSEGSPAIGTGYYNPQKIHPAIRDFNNEIFKNPPSIGAIESYLVSVDDILKVSGGLLIYPNPATEKLCFKIPDNSLACDVTIYSLKGERILSKSFTNNSDNDIISIETKDVKASGSYLIVLRSNKALFSEIIQIIK
ncbi:T9SS type A sorting domain-containing protein [Bacteroidota bacterium]